jgi:hypothetical protein
MPSIARFHLGRTVCQSPGRPAWPRSISRNWRKPADLSKHSLHFTRKF